MDTFTKTEWNSEKRKFECVQNGSGQWWPKMRVKAESGGWCDINIRDSNPFKTLNGAIRYVEQTIARIQKRDDSRAT